MTAGKTISLPADTPKFEHPTLIVCLAHHLAQPYLAKGESVTTLEQIATDETDFEYTDKEGFQAIREAGGRGTSPGTEKHTKEHYERVFLNYFADSLNTLVQQHAIKQIHIFTPADIKNLTADKLPGNLSEIATIEPGNLVKVHPLDLVKRLTASSNV